MQLAALKSEQRKIFDRLKNFPEFYLVGGTALALQIGHRISVDFDLFSAKEIPPDFLGRVKRIFKESTIKTIVNHSEQLSIKTNKTKIDFVKYNFPLVMDLIEFNGVKIVSAAEIAAMKAFALNRRGTLKDYVDLYFILKDKHSVLKEIKRIAERKYKEEFNFRLFLEQMVYLKDIKKEKIQFLKEKVGINQLEKYFQEEIKKLKL